MTKRFLHISRILTGLIMLLPAQVTAETPFPTIHEPEGEGVKCVQPEDEMRRNHMNYILHQRDETMHRGIRTKKHALKECMECHAVFDTNGQAVSHLNSKHFCVQCHEYTSVSIDCFDCHTSKPRAKKAQNSNNAGRKL